MSAETGVQVPVGPRAEAWTTVAGCRVVLGVVRTVTSVNRLLEALEVFRGDVRVQVVFAVDDTSPFVDGVHATLRAAGARIVPWAQLPSIRVDLTVTATENADLGTVAGPVVVLPHGVGFHKYVPNGAADGVRLSGVPRPRAHPPTLVVSHADQAEQLRQASPGTPAAVVGDPALERLRASARLTATYRRALGAGAGHRLVVLTSTWGPGSLWGAAPDLPHRLLAALPCDEYRVALILHPNVWFGHSPWQVRMWLADALAAGLALIPPTHGWQATVAAADVVVGDHGSVTLYGAALGIPVLLGAFGSEVVPGTAMAYLGSVAPRLAPEGDLRAQIDHAKPVPGVAERAFVAPAGSTRRLRDLFYDRLGLGVPPAEPPVLTWPVPVPEWRPASSFVVYTDVSVPGTVVLRRYPAGDPEAESDTVLRHRAAYDDEPDEGAVAAASVVVARHGRDAAGLLRRFPGAICAGAGDLVQLRDGPLVRVTADDEDRMYPAVTVYALWRSGLSLAGPVELRAGTRTVTLTLAAA